jgi:catechol 2,3-dioxygenase-like lactoylglutathione lyase family enzyme
VPGDLLSDGVPVTGVNELVLEVVDLERAEHFYSQLLGFPVVERWEHRDAIWVLAGATRIGLWKPQVGVAGGRGGIHVHFALQIAEEDYEPTVERLRGCGLKVHEDEFGDSRAAYVTDPDGNVVEFWTAALAQMYR